MTAQIIDTILVDGQKYDLVSFDLLRPTNKLLHHRHILNPEDFGLIPEAKSTGCYRGFFCTFKISEEKLFLDELTVYAKEDNYPAINGLEARLADYGSAGRYSKLNLLLNFSGNMRIARDIDSKYFSDMGYPDTLAYNTVIDLVFNNGKVLSKKDVSLKLQKMREIQLVVEDFISKNWLPESFITELKKSYGYFDRNDIYNDFDQRVRNLNYREPLEIIEEIKQLKKNLSWFISTYYDYYSRAHNYEHKFSHLNYLGIPIQLLDFLREKVNQKNTEEGVVLTFLNVLLEDRAKDKWGPSLPIIFERQFLKAQIDSSLVEKIRYYLLA